jgi:N-acetyl-anhydromuramyl-L-alanine amidase AmpD
VAIMPGALWRPLPYSSSPMTQYDILCYHTMVGSLWGTDAYFRRGSGVNSHFGVGYDGTIVQWVDTRYRSGANYNGNWHIVSVETADVGTGFPAWDLNDGSQVPAWTDAQVEANAAIATWVHETHGIPPVPIPDSKVGRRGWAGTAWAWTRTVSRAGSCGRPTTARCAPAAAGWHRSQRYAPALRAPTRRTPWPPTPRMT